ncbi:hypothetical protein HY086_04160 [Candidatus Gottesmanbacteria bacterium]|nr:hypothetical protein [Candidatus Gottesmanbacteria bacterium]
MKKQSNTFLYVVVIIGLIIAGVAATTLLNRAKEGASSDIRAKAGVANTLRISASVAAVDSAKGVFTVTNLHFASSQTGANMGTWTVTPPPGFSLGSLSPGAQLTMTIDPTTMLAESHTVTATQIIIEK